MFAPALGININEKECTAYTEYDDNTMMTFYYSIFSATQNISWAYVQISHFAIIPEITSNDHERRLLNDDEKYRCRYVQYLCLQHFMDNAWQG